MRSGLLLRSHPRSYRDPFFCVQVSKLRAHAADVRLERRRFSSTAFVHAGRARFMLSVSTTALPARDDVKERTT
jgi:hypothetical protein